MYAKKIHFQVRMLYQLYRVGFKQNNIHFRVLFCFLTLTKWTHVEGAFFT